MRYIIHKRARHIFVTWSCSRITGEASRESNLYKPHIEGWSQDCSISEGCFSQYLISSPWRRYEDYNISLCKQWKFRCNCSYFFFFFFFFFFFVAERANENHQLNLGEQTNRNKKFRPRPSYDFFLSPGHQRVWTPTRGCAIKEVRKASSLCMTSVPFPFCL